MKLKTVRIVVENHKATDKRWKRALRGKFKGRANEETISVSSFEILGKIFSPARLEILAAITILRPKSIADLSRLLKRDFKNVHSDVKFLADLGLLELREEGARKTLVPVAKYKELELPLSAQKAI
jgi:predicted transcriptional regulator